ncbi:phosphatidylserine decarboxylase [Sulfurimonas autotrophica]|uniref:Putative phosphatidylserine decarboxylase n=1 Tax=Sulfurimonas autotrophica (strain ATCC BAA-671 / DSM 16294 / JCM 11897 / OK10) TaxID=563040 RepID=E0UPW5_SULAO|nr:phosphatidylserine decarboxylase [Sulfurimonas autotrophica]ADN09774.1 putative phosphatidylserine decarboxylase [Sulfurimonas autotrophica DSM 16294]
MKNNLFIVSKNGYKYIAYALLTAIIFGILDLEFFSLLSFALALFFIYSFRNPERELSLLDDKAVVSPVDGVVKAIDEIKNGQYVYRVLVESNYMNVGVLRVPLSGHLESTKVIRGARTSKKSKLFYDLNETAELVFVDAHNNRVKVLHRLKQSFAPVNIEVSKNEPLYKGSRYGYAINSMSELYLPKNFRLDIKPNSEIQASHSLIGYFS